MSRSIYRESLLGKVMMTGCLRKSAGVSFSSMRVLGSYALVYLTAGGGHYQMRGRAPTPCRAGDLLLIFPEIAHGYGPEPGGHWNEIYVVFEGAVFDLWRQLGLLSPERPILRLLPVGLYAGILRKISAKHEADDPARQLDQVCRLQNFLARALMRDTGREGREGKGTWPAWVAAAVKQMEGHRQVPTEAIARSVGLSYESFRKKFRSITGKSPACYRNRLAVDLARKLIYEERLTNKELAVRLGFCDEFHFSRRFREATGQTPKEFRRGLSKTG